MSPDAFVLIGLTIVLSYYLLKKHLERIDERKKLEAYARSREAVNGTLQAIAQIAGSDPALANRLSEQLLSKESTRPLLEQRKSLPMRKPPELL